jgi:group I intron endonuclease
MEKYNYLYKITNKLNGRYYIGVRRHYKKFDKNYYGSGTAIRNAIAKYGKENFEVQVLSYYPDYESVLKAEKEILENHLNDPLCYNLKPGGRGGAHFGNTNAKNMTYKHSEEAKKAIAESRRGKKWSSEMIQKMSDNRKGKAMGDKNAMASDDARKKVSLSKIGRKALFKGDIKKLVIPNSEEWNKLISEGFSTKKNNCGGSNNA